MHYNTIVLYTGTDEHLEESTVPVEIISGTVAGVICVFLLVLLAIAVTLFVRRKGQLNSHNQDDNINTTPNDAYATSADITSELKLKENVAYATSPNADREVPEYDYIL